MLLVEELIILLLHLVVANPATGLGWYLYFHEPAAKVTSWDKVSSVPYTFLEPGVTGASTRITYAEFVPKQMHFLNTPEEPCGEDPNYIYEKVSNVILLEHFRRVFYYMNNPVICIFYIHEIMLKNQGLLTAL
jgi:hypothetical protein